MTANNYNSILGEIIHLAEQAELSDDDGVKRLALGDIAAALANVVPVDFKRREAEEQSGRDGCPQPSAELTGLAKFLTLAPGVQLVRFHGKDKILLVARRKGSSGNPNTVFKIVVDKENKCATVWRDEDCLFEIDGMKVDYNTVEQIAVSALHRYFERRRKCNSRRRRALKRRRLGILTPEQELARTVAEQKEGL